MGRPVYSLPGRFKPLIQAECARLGLPSKSEALGVMLDFYFAHTQAHAPVQASEQVAEQAPNNAPPPPATPTEAKPTADKWEVFISYVEASP